MGTNQALEIDAWLRDGGVVVTASERAARAIASAYHRARLDEGQKAWAAPEILSWQRFAHREWEERATDWRLVLNPIQERAIWVEIVASGGHAAATLAESRHRLAALAMDAHSLLCSHAARLLGEGTRRDWPGDSAAFSEWLPRFDAACRDTSAVSESRVPLELIAMLRNDSRPRKPLLLAGFDRLLPVQHELFEAWGNWKRVVGGEEAVATHFYAARDAEVELSACALWCKNRLAENRQARLLLVTQDAGARRGELERTFQERVGSGSSAPFEFSLGVPLNQIGIARGAMMLLRWLDGALAEHEVDWLLSAGYAVASEIEGGALQARMRELRRRNRQRTWWGLDSFRQQVGGTAIAGAWASRMFAAQQLLRSAAQRIRSPLEWAELAPRLLSAIGWPGNEPGSGIEFQATRRLQQVFDQCGSLGFNGGQLSWKEFLAELERALEETLFAPESLDAPILIAGPSESAGLRADAIWFLGASEDAWPARGSLHPLLPPEVQRETKMPHASAQIDWDLARAITERLVGSAAEVCFSYPLQAEGADMRPSRIVMQLPLALEPMPMELAALAPAPPLTMRFEDEFQVPLPPVDRSTSPGDAEGTRPMHLVRGGSRYLTMQSQCPFKAFATSRLGAEDWEPAESGLTAATRGQLLHAVMHAIWAGPPRGIRTLTELLRIPDRRAFVTERVQEVMRDDLPDSAREQMPERYLQLEARRLSRLVTEWLGYEAARLPFTVIGTELKTLAAVGDLRLELRLDRIDQLNDGSLLVVDYKTGDVKPKVWETPRPEDVQLPLYGGFGLESGSELGGLVFARIRAGDLSFAGQVGDPARTLGGVKNLGTLSRSRFEAEHLIEWRKEILRLAGDYMDGRSDVDPRDPKATCDRCGLQTLCRIQEQAIVVVEEEEQPEDADD